MPIRVLDAYTVGQIAAGEVVERPSSVVKELIENALDAGSTSVTVETRDGGMTYLRVTDNGCGIPANDVRLAFENHATSKLRDAGELTDIRTLGFRGEALPSIASVSKVEITTRERGKPSGVKARIEAGRILLIDETGCPEGTNIIVRDLFFNVPVRKSFLKKPAYEAGVISDLVTRMMLGNPDRSIRLIQNGKTVCHSFGDGNMRHTALAVYNRETAEALMEIDESSGAFRIWGLIGLGSAARPNRSHQAFFINGRLVRCQLMTQVLEYIARDRVTIGMHPLCAIHLEMPAQAVDVNVHPNKLEIRFRDEELVRQHLMEMLERALREKVMLDLQKITTMSERIDVKKEVEYREIPAEPQGVIPEKPTEVDIKQTEISLNKTEVSFAPPPPQVDVAETPGRVVIRAQEPVSQHVRELELRPAPQNSAPDPIASAAPEVVEKQAEPPEIPYHIVGVVFHTYLIVEALDSMLLIDQHAAHERILYEKYKARLEQGSAAQQLLVPVVVNLSARELAIVKENRELLSEIGYEIEGFGARDIQVRSVPFLLGQVDMKMWFVDMLERMYALRAESIDRRRAEVIQASCKHAVKGGDRLTEAEIQSLIQAMMKTNAPPTCPHGRPIIKTFKKGELEIMFKRRQ